MISIRRCWAIAAAACVVLGACTSQSAGDDDSTSSATTASGSGATTGGATGTGNTVGITDDTIKISLIATDLSQLAAQNLAPEIGNAGTTMQAVTDDINAKGGIAGRKVELIPHVLAGADAILNPDLGRQACIQATEDDKPFAVIIAAAIPASRRAVRGQRPRRADDHDGQLAGEPLHERQGSALLARVAHLDREHAALSRLAAGSSTMPRC